MTQLVDLTWPEVVVGSVLVVPLGSTEQHGPHLPLSTDTDIAVALSRRLVAQEPALVLAPALPYGASGEHAGFPGTLSIGQQALELALVELCRSATETFAKVLLVNGHGGNTGAVRRAVSLLRKESRDVTSWSPPWRGDAHAGLVETSVKLALSPSGVRTDRLTVGNTRPLSELLPTLQRDGVLVVSPTGVLGDPTGADASLGERLLAEAEQELRSHVRAWLSGVPA